MQTIDYFLIDGLIEEAASQPFLRTSKILGDRDTMHISAFRPWSPVPVHKVNEDTTLTILKGEADAVIYNELGAILARIPFSISSGKMVLTLNAGQWYTLEVRSPCAFLFNGEPPIDKLSAGDIMY